MSVRTPPAVRGPSGILRRNPYADRRSFVARAMALEPIGDIADVTFGGPSVLTWETASDWDNATSESGVAHESVTNTDHGDATVVRQGYSFSNPFKSANLDILYSFHEDSGSTAFDHSGNNRDGAITGATLGVTGLLGDTAYSLDGSDDLVDGNVTIPPDDASQPWTIAVWIKTSSEHAAKVVSRQEDQNNFEGPSLDVSTGPQLRTFIKDDANNFKDYQTDISYNDGNWHLIVSRWDGSYQSTSSRPEIFYDGSSTTASAGSTDALNQNIGSSADLAVGARDPVNGPSNHFSGDIGPVWIWNTELTSSEISTLYNVVDTPGTLTTATKSFASSESPDLSNLSYTLNGVTDIQLDIIGSPGTGSEETVTQQLDGASSYTLTWSNAHTDFRVKVYPDNEGDVTRSPTINRIELAP